MDTKVSPEAREKEVFYAGLLTNSFLEGVNTVLGKIEADPPSSYGGVKQMLEAMEEVCAETDNLRDRYQYGG